MASISISTIEQWHNAILLRQPDDATARFWLSELRGQSSDPGKFIKSVLDSPEYSDNVLPVMILYQIGLGSIPSLEGLRTWLSVLPSGQSIASLAESFTNPSEYGDLFGSTPTGSLSDKVVTTLFQKTFGRVPTAAEITLWTSSGLSQSQLLTFLVQSQEALERFTESSYVISAYLALEGQLPSQEQLQAAMTMGDMMQILNGLLADAFLPGTDPLIDDASDGDGLFTGTPTLTLNFDPLISASLTAQSSLRGVLLLSDQSISEVQAGIPIALNDLPMLDTLTSAPLIAQSEAGERSTPTSQIVTLGTTGDDVFDAEGESTIQYVFTGPGNDSIYSGTNNDYLSGGDGNDAIWGEDGNDLILGSAGADTLDGGYGIDTLSYSDLLSADSHGIEEISGMAMNLTPGPLVWDVFIEELASFNDAFIQSEWLQARVIDLQNQAFGSSGDENPNELAENSVAYLLSTERDLSAPRDSVSNFEIIIGSPLDDFIFTVGDYEINGAHGSDIILGQGNQLILRGGQGNDFLFATGNSIELDGGSGDDILVSFPPYYEPEYDIIPTTRVTGGAGADQMVLAFGGQDYISLYAEASDELNLGGSSNSNYLEQDRIIGLSSEDFFELHLNNVREFSPDNIRFEVMDGESVPPVYLYSVNTNPLADIEAPDIGSAGDIQVLITNTLIDESDYDDLSSFWADRSILNLTGTDQNDSLTGGVNNDTISGGDGNDFIQGGDGNNLIEAGGGLDTIAIGNGANTIVFNASAQIESEDTVTIGWSDSNREGKDVIIGFDDDDSILLNLYNLEDFLFEEDIQVSLIDDAYLYAVDTNYLADDLSSGPADLEITIYSSIDASDTLNLKERTILNLYGSEYNDFIHAGNNSDTIRGGEGNDAIDGADATDFLYGDAGNDQIQGGNGDDLIDGGDGNDLIDGGMGADALSGGDGSDTFQYGAGSTGTTIDTADTIEDFVANEDMISIGIPDYLSTDASFRMEDGSTLSDFGQFVGRADQAFVDGMTVFVAFNVGFLSGDGLSAINHDGNGTLSDGDSLIVLVGVNTESSISGANFIAEVD